MHIQDIERQIRELIQELYGEIYIGKLKVEALESKGYCITFGMQDTNLPITICAELDDDKFFDYLRKELKEMRLNRVHYGKLYSVEPPQYYDIPCQKKI